MPKYLPKLYASSQYPDFDMCESIASYRLGHSLMTWFRSIQNPYCKRPS